MHIVYRVLRPHTVGMHRHGSTHNVWQDRKATGIPVSYTHLDVYKRQGVGSGIVINGQMVYGHDGFAGELGHTIIPVSYTHLDVYKRQVRRLDGRFDFELVGSVFFYAFRRYVFQYGIEREVLQSTDS